MDVSCASCHSLALGGSDGRKLSIGTGGRTPTYNTPTVFNIAIVKKYGWEGDSRTLAEATTKAMVSPNAMGMTWEAAAQRLQDDEEMVLEFGQVYGTLTGAALLELVMDYLKQLIPRNSPFDRYLFGEQQALTLEQKEGYQRFKDLGCVSCHQGVGVGGNMFAPFGVMLQPTQSEAKSNLGRFNSTQKESDLHVFRVPSLRNVALTAPYFHNGSAENLASAILTMGYVQLGQRLSDHDVQILSAFLRSLTGQLPPEVLP